MDDIKNSNKTFQLHYETHHARIPEVYDRCTLKIVYNNMDEIMHVLHGFFLQVECPWA